MAGLHSSRWLRQHDGEPPVIQGSDLVKGLHEEWSRLGWPVDISEEGILILSSDGGRLG